MLSFLMIKVRPTSAHRILLSTELGIPWVASRARLASPDRDVVAQTSIAPLATFSETTTYGPALEENLNAAASYQQCDNTREA